MTRHETEREIRDFIKARFPRFHERWGTEDPIEHVVDSLGMFDLAEWVESRFSIAIPVEEFSPRRFASIDAICRTIQEFST